MLQEGMWTTEPFFSFLECSFTPVKQESMEITAYRVVLEVCGIPYDFHGSIFFHSLQRLYQRNRKKFHRRITYSGEMKD